MAQTLFLPPVVLPGSIPSSPDPTPLRLIAFSVAEAALQPDPNSPSLGLPYSDKTTAPVDWFDSWSMPSSKDALGKSSPPSSDTKRGASNLWDVLERGKERRERTPSPEQTVSGLPPSSPVSPSAYRFTLPPNSPLAKSVASSPEHRVPARRFSPEGRSITGPRLDLRWSKGGTPFPLFTRSAEPSPTTSTFSTLDQRRPPPEFVPRPGEVMSKKESKQFGLTTTQSRSNGHRSTTMPTSRHNSRLPSLAQIQAKMAKSGHRRGSSVDGIPAAPPAADPKEVYRTSSNESIEVLQTPTDEFPPTEPRIVFESPERRTVTPPPNDTGKESRLAPFLRERTSGRLAGARNRPLSMPPLSGININLLSFADKTAERPGVTLTPPRGVEADSFVSVPPPSPSRNIILNTPPRKSASKATYSSPASPTSTNRSATASPTLSVPTITCTPAPERLVRNGVELDSDEEGGDVVLFEGDSESVDGEDSPVREERERRAKQMLERLTQRRRSD